MKKRIVIVDDADDNRAIMRRVLEGEFDVGDYADGPSALEGLAVEPAHLVLLDISMPVMDGFEVLRRMRADPRLCDLLVVAFTALATEAERSDYVEMGFDDLILKPAGVEPFRARVRELLARGGCSQLLGDACG